MSATQNRFAAVLAFVVLGFSPCFAGTENQLRAYAVKAISENEGEARAAIAALRDAGPAGLQAVFETHAAVIQKKSADPAWSRVSATLDAVAQQKDADASHLYWYTDFEKAKTAAKESSKPILSLRLLGKLDEEFSCANSRFFRTVLYANDEVSKVLREQFVLHWQSVRPVPKVTIDFGDGRKLERTITGNSIHYILDSDGRPVDALPGLYGPKAFLRELERAEQCANTLASTEPATREAILRRYHEARRIEIEKQWAADLAKLGVSTPAQPTILPSANNPPSAAQAARVAVGKSMVEAPLLRAMQPALQSLEARTDDATWARIAQLHADEARLDEGSRSLMRAKNPAAFNASRLAMTKARVEDPLLRVAASFERSIAEDTVRNEYLLHAKLHAWFARGAVQSDANALNERVYTELFLTPSTDPWLGLVPRDTYTALPNNGLVGHNGRMTVPQSR